MYYYLAFFLGIVLKTYDDVVDTQIVFDKVCLKLLSYLIIFLTVFITIDDFLFGVVALCCLVSSYYCNKLDNDFWMYYFYIVAFTVVVFSSNVVKCLKYFYIKLFFILFIPISQVFEEMKFTEEVSSFKIKSRISFIILSTFAIFMMDHYGITDRCSLEFFKKIILFVDGYFLTNIIFKLVYLPQL